MSEQTACPPPDELRRFLDGTLGEEAQLAIESHVNACEACQAKLDSFAVGSQSSEMAVERLRDLPTTDAAAMQQALEQIKADGEESGEEEAERVLKSLAPSDYPGAIGRLGPYEVLEVIGWGGMGSVFKAFDPTLHRVVAVKVLAPHLAHKLLARRRFIREAQAAAAVSHDHVVTIHAIDESPEQPKIVMQYVAGQSLQQKLDAEGPLELKEILRIAMQTASGLAAAHAQGLVHRDVKPANILLENGVQRVKLTDFGLARAVDDASLTMSGIIAGTPQFMSPEQAAGGAIDHRADLFSLGSVLYAMCVGHSPFRASTTLGVIRNVCDATPRQIRDLNPDVPDWLSAIIDRLLAKDPAHRLQTAKEVAELFEHWLAHVQQPLNSPRPPLTTVVQDASRRPQPGGVPAHATSAPTTTYEAPPVAASLIQDHQTTGTEAELGQSAKAAWSGWYATFPRAELPLVYRGFSWTPVRFALLCSLWGLVAMFIDREPRFGYGVVLGWCLSIPLRRWLAARQNGIAPSTVMLLPPSLAETQPLGPDDSPLRRGIRRVGYWVRQLFNATFRSFPVCGEDWWRDVFLVAGPGVVITAICLVVALFNGWRFPLDLIDVLLLSQLVYCLLLLIYYLRTRIARSPLRPVAPWLWGVALLISVSLFMTFMDSDTIPVALVAVVFVLVLRRIAVEAGLLPSRDIVQPATIAASSEAPVGAVFTPHDPSAPSSGSAGPSWLFRWFTDILPPTWNGRSLWLMLLLFPLAAGAMLIGRLESTLPTELPRQAVRTMQLAIVACGLVYLLFLSVEWFLRRRPNREHVFSPLVAWLGITFVSAVVIIAVSVITISLSGEQGEDLRGHWPTRDQLVSILEPTDVGLAIALAVLCLIPFVWLVQAAFRRSGGRGAHSTLASFSGLLALFLLFLGGMLCISATLLLAYSLSYGSTGNDPSLRSLSSRNSSDSPSGIVR